MAKSSKKNVQPVKKIAPTNSQKKAANENLRKGGDILDFLPIKSIENGLITFTTGKYGKVIKVGSLNISYLSLEEQQSKMRQLANVFNTINADCSIIKSE